MPAFDVALVIIGPNNEEPEHGILIPWPAGMPLPLEGHTFIWDDDKYMVVDAEFNYCQHHDVPTVHMVLTVQGDSDDDFDGSGADIRLP